jgi:hypothetical protein
LADFLQAAADTWLNWLNWQKRGKFKLLGILLLVAAFKVKFS